MGIVRTIDTVVTVVTSAPKKSRKPGLIKATVKAINDRDRGK